MVASWVVLFLVVAVAIVMIAITIGLIVGLVYSQSSNSNTKNPKKASF